MASVYVDWICQRYGKDSWQCLEAKRSGAGILDFFKSLLPGSSGSVSAAKVAQDSANGVPYDLWQRLTAGVAQTVGTVPATTTGGGLLTGLEPGIDEQVPVAITPTPPVIPTTGDALTPAQVGQNPNLPAPPPGCTCKAKHAAHERRKVVLGAFVAAIWLLH